MKEAAYRHITYDLTITAAQTLVRLNPGMTFLYVSGASTDSSEKGRIMWARVKGATENALLRMPFKAAYMFRPGAILPLNGIQSKTRSYRVLYELVAPLQPHVLRLFPNAITTTEQLGQAMLQVARLGSEKKILEAKDICSTARGLIAKVADPGGIRPPPQPASL